MICISHSLPFHSEKNSWDNSENKCKCKQKCENVKNVRRM